MKKDVRDFVLKIMGIAVSAFLLGFGACKALQHITGNTKGGDNPPAYIIINPPNKLETNDIHDKKKIDLHDTSEIKSDNSAEQQLTKVMVLPSPSEITTKDSWVTLYEDDNFRGRQITFNIDGNFANFHDINFDNKASSAKWNIAVGHKAILFGDRNYKGSQLEFVGNGQEQSIADFKTRKVGDQGSSLKWYQ